MLAQNWNLEVARAVPATARGGRHGYGRPLRKVAQDRHHREPEERSEGVISTTRTPKLCDET